MALNLHTEICDTLGIEYPIFGFNHCRDVTAEICNAGGIGVLGCTGKTPDEIRAEFDWLRKHTNKPFGVDLLLPSSSPEGGTREDLLAKIPQANIDYMNKLRKELGLPDGYMPETRAGDDSSSPARGTRATQMEQVDMICELKPALFAAGLGNSPEVVKRCHKAGVKVVSLVGNVRQARRVANMGVDMIVAQGHEAGGHTGRIATMVLVPLVVDAVKPIPVLAAGGIGDGRQVVAALALGAVGVWTGTIWLTSHTHPLEDFIKEKLINATEEDTIVSRCHSGKTRRALKTEFTAYWERPGAPSPCPMPYQGMYTPVPGSLTTETAEQTWRRPELQAWVGTPAGQIVGLLNQRRTTKQIMYDLVSQAIDVLEA